MISTGQRLRGMAALVALLAVVVGVPWALVAVGGNPLPTSLSGSLLTEPLGADAILGVLIAVMWVAWAHFMVCLVIELRAHRRHRDGVTTAQGTSHPLVRRLVASIVLVASSAAVSATAAEAAQPVASHATFVSRVAADADALRQLADQAPEAHVAIAPKVGNDVQAKLGLRYIVQPPHSGNYDSLWAIAERLLGDGRRWREIYDLNKAVLQADGTSLQDADLIYPGWQLLLPDDATGNAVLGDRGNHNVNDKSDGRDQSSGRDGGSAPRQQSTQTAPQPATADVSSPAEDHTPITASVGGLVGL
nr:LysM peptidoglycan-binding domain-containing protein [Nocardioidaceae bacterium]